MRENKRKQENIVENGKKSRKWQKIVEKIVEIVENRKKQQKMLDNSRENGRKQQRK